MVRRRRRHHDAANLPQQRRRRRPFLPPMPLVAAAAILLLFGALLRPAHGAGFRGPNGYPGQNSGQVTLGVLRDEAIRNGAVCLDGSPPAYYFRPGFGSGRTKYLLYYEGGGWCSGDVDCVFRGHTTLGSSKHYWLRNDVSTGLGSYFLNASRNPLHDWNVLVMKYCDGSSFASYLKDPVPNAGVFRNNTVYYRGQRVHEAFMDEFITNHDLLEATDVVLAGCSAGGLAVYLHIDEVAALFEKENEKRGRGQGHGITKVRGLADSGFFLDVDGPGGCHAVADLRWQARRLHSPAISNPAHLTCLGTAAQERRARRQRKEAAGQSGGAAGALDGEEEDAWGLAAEDRARCLFAKNIIPGLRTPVFSFVSRYDGAQLASFSCLTPEPENNATQPTLNPQAITDAGKAFREALVESHEATAVPHGYYLDACHRHCFWAGHLMQTVINPWTNIHGAAGGKTPAQVFWSWYNDEGSPADWRVEADPDAAFPCPDCCGVPLAG